MELTCNEKTGAWEEEYAPFATVDFLTEDDYNQFLRMIDFWDAHHKDEETDNHDE